ncbi:MAG: hypothetical protein J2P36_09105, partial [Ktedonobacteraceae bacterium]|nr:hypothetical protein [Ktedonobacteraceae bacterium]
HICARWGIPARKADAHGGITGHYSIDPVNRARCPGPYPWDELFAFLQDGGDALVLNIEQTGKHFVETVRNERWHCQQTGFDIAYAILAYYRSCTHVGLNGLSQYGLPISNEQRVDGTQQAIIQRFERGCILYDPQHEVDRVSGISGPCYPAHIDKAPGEDPRIAQLQEELAKYRPPDPPKTDMPQPPPKTSAWSTLLATFKSRMGERS